MTEARIRRVTGSLVEAGPLPTAAVYELARVGERHLLGEVIRVDGDRATLQVYEDTTGLAVGEPLQLSGESLTAHLGPGLLGSVLDGLGRRLHHLAATAGDLVRPGAEAVTLETDRTWTFRPTVRTGEQVGPGDVLGIVEERPGFEHRVLLPPRQEGTIGEIREGEFTVTEPFGRLTDGTPLLLAHRWPVRTPRPTRQRLPDDRPFVTGQRIFDFLFPVAEGGTVAVPGGFGTGKTVIEQSLAKYGEADVVVYVGCGERGNEMAEVLAEFPRLEDPRTGRSIMDRTVMVVNTSNMPVAAREASVYLGVTIAEYYRDMGYRVAVMVDSLSRWAEALREISARLQEMPGEEGYPTYLADRLGRFYERAGRAVALGRPERQGALTLISAISPPGGDLSEPVTQASLRVAGALWALDAALAHERQFPAVDWEMSYSLYGDTVTPWFEGAGGTGWGELRRETLELLQRGRELHEIAMLVGPDTLQDADRLVLEMTRLVRETVLAQSAYDPNDARSSVLKTWRLATLARDLQRAAGVALESGASFEHLDLAPARRALGALRAASDSDLEARAAEATNAIAALGRPRGQP
jgi:V/A-type H+/Na+-transporting ATPase subunit A